MVQWQLWAFSGSVSRRGIQLGRFVIQVEQGGADEFEGMAISFNP